MDETTGMPPQPPAPPAPQVTGDRPGPDNSTSKLLAILGYIFWPVALVALLIDPYKGERFVRFHAVQGLVLNVVSWIAWLIPVIGWVAGIVLLVFTVIAIIKAANGEYYEIPLVYDATKGFINE